MRRLLWYQICFLDLRTCEAVGPRPQIRREEYDTQFPLNVEDEDLERGWEVKEDSARFTDMTITRMRLECYEMQRLLWIERPKLSKKKSTITALLSKIQSFKEAMEKKYLPMMDTSVPLHVWAMEMYNILSGRMYLMILQIYLSNEKRVMPERLRMMMMGSAVMVLEHTMTLENTPALGPWSWYVGALHQNHTALLLLNEIYATPPEPTLEARVWRCLDYVFELAPGLPGRIKRRMLLEELITRTEAYAEMRKIRAPTNMKLAGPRSWVSGCESAETQKAKEKERERLDRESSSSVQSGVSSQQSPPPQMGTLGAGVPSSSQPQHQARQYQHSTHIPNVNYSLAGMMPTGGGVGANPALNNPELTNFSYFPATGVPGAPGVLAANIVPGPGGSGMGTGSDTSSNTGMAATTGSGRVMGGSSANSGSPMEGMPDIDWVS